MSLKIIFSQDHKIMPSFKSRETVCLLCGNLEIDAIKNDEPKVYMKQLFFQSFKLLYSHFASVNFDLNRCLFCDDHQQFVENYYANLSLADIIAMQLEDFAKALNMHDVFDYYDQDNYVRSLFNELLSDNSLDNISEIDFPTIISKLKEKLV